MDWLTITTSGALERSLTVKVRPWSSGMPIARKKSPCVLANMENCSFQLATGTPSMV